MTHATDAITRPEPTRQGATIENIFGAVSDGEIVTTEYLATLAHHGRELFESISPPAAAFCGEVLARLRSASLYGLPYYFTRADLEALFADVRRAVESGEAVDGGGWVEVVGRKGMVRLGVARAHGWKVRGEG